MINQIEKIQKKYDYLIVGAGLFGATFASLAKRNGKSCLVIDRRGHIAGNAYTEEIAGINVHCYGAHIFHTSDEEVWRFVNEFAKFNAFVNEPLANYKGEYFNLPFNMNTFNQLWGVTTKEEAQAKIKEQSESLNSIKPENLEEQALSFVGRDVYEKLIKEYTEKQWGRDCKDLPAFIIRRLPLRFTYDNNYFDDKYQGIPIGGYTKTIENMLDGIDVMLNTDYCELKVNASKIADKTVFSGSIDNYFDYCYGALEYRSLRFEHEVLNIEGYQKSAVVNYTSRDVPYTRIIEHKHFEFANVKQTVITREYPKEWVLGDEPYYPINDKKNEALYKKYAEKAKARRDVIFGGRLGAYKYYDMDKVIRLAMDAAADEFGK